MKNYTITLLAFWALLASVQSQDLANCNVNTVTLELDASGFAAAGLEATISFQNDCGCNGVGDCEIVRVEYPSNLHCSGTIAQLRNGSWYDDYFDIYYLPDCIYHGKDNGPDPVNIQMSNYIFLVDPPQTGGSYDILICAGEELPAGQTDVLLNFHTSDLCWFDDCSNDSEAPVFDCAANQIDISIGPNGIGSLDITNYNFGITDNCNDFTISPAVVNVNCNELEFSATQPIYTSVIATDNIGNSTNCSILLNITDPNGYCNDCSNNALTFDGVDDKIVVPTPLQGNSDYTISMDFNCGPQANGPYNRLFGFSDFQAEVGINESNLSFYNGAQWFESGALVADNLWYNATLTRQGTMIHLYLNGNLITSEAAPATLNFMGNMGIGHKHLGGGSNEHFKGSIDNVKVWNSALSADEVCANVETGLFPNTLFFDLEEGISDGNNSAITGPFDSAGGDNIGEFRGFELMGNTSNYTCQNVDLVACDISSNQQLTHEEFNMFPNPTSNTLVLEAEESKILNYNIYSMEGLSLISEQNLQSQVLEIDVSGLINGVFFIEFTDENRRNHSLRFIKI